MATQRLNSLIEYSLTDDNKSVQLILHPGAEIDIDISSLLWFSEGAQVKDNNNLLDRILKKLAIGVLVNSSMNTVGCGLSQIEPGPVLTIPLEQSEMMRKKIYISKDCFLCSVDRVQSAILPIQFTLTSLTISVVFLAKLPALLNSFYLCEKKPNDNITHLFLQSGSEILVKDLKVGETYNLNAYCLVGFEDTVKLELTTKTVFGNSLWGVNFLKCNGPGKIFFVSHSNKRKNSMRRDSDKTIVPILSIIGVILNFIIAILSFYTVTTILSKLSDTIQLENFEETFTKAFNLKNGEGVPRNEL